MARRSRVLWVWCVCGLLGSGGGRCLSTELQTIDAGLASAAERTGRPLRELSTDRPDTTESPFTVNAGHVQFEGDFAHQRRTNSADARVREWSLGTTNVRVGLADQLEIGIFVAPWTRQVVETSGPAASRDVRSGFGDLTVRGKINFAGNDGGPFAIGLIAEVTFPMAARDLGVDRTGALVLLPWTVELPGKWTLGSMTGAEWRRSVSDDALVWINTASFSHDLTDSVGGYLEVTSEAGDGPHVATFDAGLTFQINPNFQLDCGVNLGISRAADDLVVFAGFARRF